MNGTLVILIHDNARYPSLWQHETPNLTQKQNILPHVRHSHTLRLSSRDSHTLLSLEVSRNRPPCTHHSSPGHRRTVSRLARVASIPKRNQMKPFHCPYLKCNPKTTCPYCIPQNTKCRFPVDHLRRATVPCYDPHGIYDIRSTRQSTKEMRSTLGKHDR